MPARIIETETAPLGHAEVDPITLDILENALRNARVEMDATLFRTALSPGIREQGDAFPLIADRMGRMVVGPVRLVHRRIHPQLRRRHRGWRHHPSQRPLFGRRRDHAYQRPIGDRADLSQGPVDRVVGDVRAHGPMSGGKVPGSLPTDAGSIYEEGLRLPPVKLYRRGEFQGDILKIAAHQSRMPEWYKADLHALVASCRVAARRVQEMCERFGDEVFDAPCRNCWRAITVR